MALITMSKTAEELVDDLRKAWIEVLRAMGFHRLVDWLATKIEEWKR